MSYIFYCDACNEVMKDSEERRILLYTSALTQKDKKKLIDRYSSISGQNVFENALKGNPAYDSLDDTMNSLKKVHEKVVCSKCWELLSSFFEMRSRKIKDMREELEQNYNVKGEGNEKSC